MTLVLVVGAVCFCFGTTFGVLIVGLVQSNQDADTLVAEALKHRISDRLVTDVHVFRDDLGQEHIVPTQPPDAA